MASLSFQNVAFAYETLAQPIIDNFSVQFPTGWTGIVGPNGAGKTTILQLAAGILSPLQGSIHRRTRWHIQPLADRPSCSRLTVSPMNDLLARESD
ncbi:MAG TPA: ATP-binding cassette domain-containing protein [Phycisphaerae bacterium]|nr:ATP-binding cassette domain-containing protein [Phycisphaerae bacterium]HOJ74247.1 ATP-binding cassette domain-containing protein [Phycisphaerae bacterium]HOM51326.1 ATP-binding cassette domain-containing protein [Phycisphaerae bacterium]HON65133.1 ATP-binding cassette domain-containing protein [Phycisphaerae bacterium]HOQ86968.1 ATP-binding cassette domain-containing protein [Phycisphaerae bacterium]